MKRHHMVVDTENSRYVFDPKMSQVIRFARNRRLRKDKVRIPIKEVKNFTLGEPMVLLLNLRGDGILTTRTTTPVVCAKSVFIGRFT